MTKPFDPFNQCTEYYYRIEKLLADNTALKAENESLRKDMLAAAQEENGRLENQVLARDAELWGRTQEILGLKDQLAKADQLWQVAQGRCDGLEEKLAKAEQRVVRQYYFKDNSCKAESAHDPDCICWHDEGTGPMQPLLDGTYLVPMTWRKFVKEV